MLNISYLEAKPNNVQVNRAVLVLESLLEGVHADLLPSLERLGGVALAHALDAQVLEDVGHVGLGDLHGADALLAQAWNGRRLQGKLVTGYTGKYA